MIDKADFMTMEEKLSDKDLQDILIEYEYYQDGRLSEAPTSVVRSIRAESHSKGYLIDLSSYFEKAFYIMAKKWSRLITCAVKPLPSGMGSVKEKDSSNA